MLEQPKSKPPSSTSHLNKREEYLAGLRGVAVHALLEAALRAGPQVLALSRHEREKVLQKLLVTLGPRVTDYVTSNDVRRSWVVRAVNGVLGRIEREGATHVDAAPQLPGIRSDCLHLCRRKTPDFRLLFREPIRVIGEVKAQRKLWPRIDNRRWQGYAVAEHVLAYQIGQPLSMVRMLWLTCAEQDMDGDLTVGEPLMMVSERTMSFRGADRWLRKRHSISLEGAAERLQLHTSVSSAG